MAKLIDGSNGEGVTPTEADFRKAAESLVLLHCLESELPGRLRKASVNRKDGKEPPDSDLERRFEDRIRRWLAVIAKMRAHLPEDCVWRLVTLKPQPSGLRNSVMDDPDFVVLIDYLRQRRDIDACPPEEVGALAELSVDYQRRIPIAV
jgi:hypothetical protein